MATDAKRTSALVMRQQAEIAAFEMPRIAVGDKVRWYQFGVRDDSRVQSATVCKVMHRSVDLQIDGGLYRSAVKHCDDPRLRMSNEQRDSGAWEYTINHNRQEAFQHEVLQRFEDLERRMAAVEAGKPEPEPTNRSSTMAQLWELRRAVQDKTGQADWSKLNKEQCEAILGAAPAEDADTFEA